MTMRIGAGYCLTGDARGVLARTAGSTKPEALEYTAEQRRRAVRACAVRVADAGELAAVLDMLGLDPREGR